MKTLLFLFSFIPVLAFCQNKPFKGANRIAVPLQDTSGILQRISLVLYQKNYAIAHKDEKQQFISTESKGLPKHPAEMKVQVLIKGDTAVFSGLMSITAMHLNQFDVLKYGGMKGSPMRDAWEELESIAKAINPIIQYRKD